MIETALLGTQPGTQPGALIGPSAAKQAGAPESADLFGSSPAGPSLGSLQSSLAAVTRGAFRKSLEEFTGPLVPEQGTAVLSTQPTDTLAKSSLPPSGSLLSNVRAAGKEPSTPALDPAIAPDSLQTGPPSGVTGDALKKGQAVSQLASGVQPGTGDARQLGQAAGQVGQAGRPPVEVRIANPSSALKPISSHTPRVPLLGGTGEASSPKITMTGPPPLTASEAAALPQPTESATATSNAGPVQTPVPALAEPPAAVPTESLSTAAPATPQLNPPATALPIAIAETSSSKIPPAGKEITTKSNEGKSNRLAGKSTVVPLPAPTQPSAPSGIAATAPQPATVAAARQHIPETGPVATTPAQPLPAVSAPTVSTAPVSTIAIGTASQLTPIPAAPGAPVTEPSTAPAQDPVAATPAPTPSGAPVTFAQVLDLQAPGVPAIQRPSPVEPAAANTAAAATHPPLPAIAPAPAPEKPGADKASQLSDQFQTSDAAASASIAAPHATPPTQVAEPALPLTTAVPHIAPVASLVQPGTTAAAVPLSAHPLAASLNEPSATLSYTSASDSSGFAQHTTLLSTPNVLEVGVASGSHGWLKVRAELDGAGGVSASVIANSTSAAATMHKDLPALSAYLSSESVGVSSLVVNQAGATGLGTAGAAAQDAAMNLGAGAGGGGPARDQSQLAQPPSTVLPDDTSRERIDIVSSRLDSGFSHSQLSSQSEGLAAGSWLSVRA